MFGNIFERSSRAWSTFSRRSGISVVAVLALGAHTARSCVRNGRFVLATDATGAVASKDTAFGRIVHRSSWTAVGARLQWPEDKERVKLNKVELVERLQERANDTASHKALPQLTCWPAKA